MTSIADMASDYKFRGMDKYRAWDQYIIDTGLKPKINSAEFYAIFSTVVSKQSNEYKRPNGFIATHHDNYLNLDCQMMIDELGVWSVVWEDGHTGSYPPCNPPELGRYVEVHND